ncbi:NAD-binding protein [Eubacterium maltosivorans]|uniref:TrkA family potassium uptake protein n=1 Tax=Eubacterium maltosivorans TaxID=2041044 RepID=A0A4P9C4G1_EUBML|nr:NAD-binding protein [Eubacterium maltosivorans]QCT70183.1 TrkA family potassium uptake protein [Eubacterium maltosivorans]
MKTSVKKTAVIVGCSQMGARLAMSLSNKGYKVVIMDKDYHAFERIDRHFLGTEFLGDGQDLTALRSLGVDNIKLFVAATGNDADNLTLSRKAEKLYHLSRVYARLSGSRSREQLKRCATDHAPAV